MKKWGFIAIMAAVVVIVSGQANQKISGLTGYSAVPSADRTGISLLHAAAESGDKQESKKAQSHCPVMGGEIDREVHADHEGKRVYFCCAGCTTKFEEDPEKYIKKLEEEGVELEKTPES